VASTGEEDKPMQSGFCTNCGQPLTPGATFCASCGTRVDASPATPSSTAYSGPSGTPPYVPGGQPSFTPNMSPSNAPKNPSRGWVGWVVGCLAAALAVLALLIGLIVFGLLTHHLIFFAIGMGGLAVILLIGVAIEHLIRRLYLRAKYGLERDIGLGGSPYGGRPGYGGGARTYRQPRFNPIRFIFSLAIIAGLIYGGLYLYYTQQFVGMWSGVLTIGSAKQGVQTTLQISVVPHSPGHASFSDLPSLAVTQVQFKTATVQPCKTSSSYQLSGTASRLDASTVAMTLNTGKENVPLTGTYQNDAFNLSGKNAAGQTVSLILEKGTDQAGYLSACGG
jgi:hypothetical protein